jgi:isopentenyl diphosphate isomerase/L-lactate dehydrogenase-like FMN-dependent dehydrogenase
MAVSGSLPADIYCARDYETLARQALDPAVFAHLAGGGGRDRAVQANLDALDAVTIIPRVLRDLTAGSTTCRLAGRDWAHPIWLAPLAFQGLFHPGGELETARAADAVGAGMALSTLSSVALEDVARGAKVDRWFQLYFQPSRQVTLDLARRAEAAGYTALMVTVDAAVKPVGPSALRAGFRGDERAVNLEPYDVPTTILEPGQSRVFQGFMRDAPTWADIDWLASNTTLPLWIKGVLHPDDAVTAKAAGAIGVVVSNHGGRTLDGAPSSLSVLPEVRAAVGEHYPLLFDGGVRSGEDIFRAIALGADGVMVGRLQACGLAVAGALGVAHMVRMLREELEVCMAMAGCATLADIRRAPVRRAGQGSNGC